MDDLVPRFALYGEVLSFEPDITDTSEQDEENQDDAVVAHFLSLVPAWTKLFQIYNDLKAALAQSLKLLARMLGEKAFKDVFWVDHGLVKAMISAWTALVHFDAIVNDNESIAMHWTIFKRYEHIEHIYC